MTNDLFSTMNGSFNNSHLEDEEGYEKIMKQNRISYFENCKPWQNPWGLHWHELLQNDIIPMLELVGLWNSELLISWITNNLVQQINFRNSDEIHERMPVIFNTGIKSNEGRSSTHKKSALRYRRQQHRNARAALQVESIAGKNA